MASDPLATNPGADDPVLVRRARIARWVAIGKRAGYSLLLVAVVAFVIGFPTGFPGAVTTTVTVCLGMCTVILAPSIVFDYGVKAANRQDRETRGRNRGADGQPSAPRPDGSDGPQPD